MVSFGFFCLAERGLSLLGAGGLDRGLGGGGASFAGRRGKRGLGGIGCGGIGFGGIGLAGWRVGPAEAARGIAAQKSAKPLRKNKPQRRNDLRLICYWQPTSWAEICVVLFVVQRCLLPLSVIHNYYYYLLQ